MDIVFIYLNNFLIVNHRKTSNIVFIILWIYWLVKCQKLTNEVEGTEDYLWMQVLILQSVTWKPCLLINNKFNSKKKFLNKVIKVCAQLSDRTS